MKKLLVVMAILLLSGCSIMSPSMKKIDGFPQDLKTTVHTVSYQEVQQHCGNNVPFLLQVVMLAHVAGCAQINLPAYTCDMWVQANDPGTLEHERKHCKGYWHEDTENMPAYFDKWVTWKQGLKGTFNPSILPSTSK